MAYDTTQLVDGQIFFDQEKVWVTGLNKEVLMAGEGNQQIINEIKHMRNFGQEVPTQPLVREYQLDLLTTYDEKYKCFTRSWEMFIGGSSNLFHVHSNGLLSEVSEFEAIGRGREVALAILNMTRDKMPEERIRNVFLNASLFCNGVSSDYRVEFI